MVLYVYEPMEYLLIDEKSKPILCFSSFFLSFIFSAFLPSLSLSNIHCPISLALYPPTLIFLSNRSHISSPIISSILNFTLQTILMSVVVYSFTSLILPYPLKIALSNIHASAPMASHGLVSFQSRPFLHDPVEPPPLHTVQQEREPPFKA